MKIPKPIRKHVKRINRRSYGLYNGVTSPKHKRIKLKEVKYYLRGETDYCPCCGNCREYDCRDRGCSLCRPDMTRYSQFKQETQDLHWADFLHKSGKIWSKFFDVYS
jgi:hypothetical protein